MVSILDVGLISVVLLFMFFVSKQIIVAVLVVACIYIFIKIFINDPRHAKLQLVRSAFGRGDQHPTVYEVRQFNSSEYPALTSQ